MKNKSKRYRSFLFLSLIILTAVICYSNSFNVPFQYDDRKVILTDYRLRDLHNLHEIVFSNPTRGLSNLSFALNYHFNGFNPFGYHLVNLFFHLINGGLVYLISYELIFGTEVLSLLTSLFFIAHPINVESVTYISSRSGIMSTTFFLLSFYIFNRLFNDKKNNFRNKILLYLLALVFYVFSIMSKETGITLPAILILYEFCFLADRRGFLTPSVKQPAFRQAGNVPHSKLKKDYLIYYKLYYLPFFAVTGALMLQRKYFYGTFSNPTFKRDYYVNILTQINVSIEYIKLLFYPVNLNIDHDFPLTRGIDFKTLLSLAAVLLVLYVAFKCLKSFREITFSVFWFFITLSPTSIIPLEDVLSERWLYLPSIGFSILLAVLISVVASLFKRGNKFLSINYKRLNFLIIFAVVLSMSLATYYRNRVWKDGLSLWHDAAEKSPEKARPHNNLGAEYLALGKKKEALQEFKKAVLLEPGYIDANVNLGVLYGMEGNFDSAFYYINKSLSLNPKNAVAFNNLGNIYKAKGKGSLAIEAYKKAIELNPDYGDPYYNIGIIYRDSNMFAEAEREFKKAVELNPEMPDRHIELGLLYVKTDRIEPAFDEFKKALELDPENTEAFNNLGIIFAMLKKYDEARQMFRKALEAAPSNINAGINLAQTYIQMNEYDNAIEVLKNALQFAPGFYVIYNMLGKVYQLKGAKDEAVKNFKTSLRLNPENKNAESALKELE